MEHVDLLEAAISLYSLHLSCDQLELISKAICQYTIDMKP